MIGIVTTVLIVQLVIPVLLLMWLAGGGRRPRLSRTMDLAIVVVYVGATWVVGLWLALPDWIPLMLLLLSLVFGLLTLARPKANADRTPMALLIRFGFLIAISGVLLVGLGGRRPREVATISLRVPLGPGLYQIANGGSNSLVNAHLATLSDPGFSAFRGQSYAVDVVGLGEWGSRARLDIMPHLPEHFAIFGSPVLAPCSGTVVRAVDGRPDMVPGVRDTVHKEGNHIILACQGVWVVLAHLQRGTTKVSAGGAVREGDVLGRVGNSGQSDEPHLHVHAQTPGPPERPLSGEPVQILFDGVLPYRNQRLAVH